MRRMRPRPAARLASLPYACAAAAAPCCARAPACPSATPEAQECAVLHAWARSKQQCEQRRRASTGTEGCALVRRRPRRAASDGLPKAIDVGFLAAGGAFYVMPAGNMLGNSNGWPNYVGDDDDTWDPSSLDIYTVPAYTWKNPGTSGPTCAYPAVIDLA
eukprot:Tamp_33772.p2 GENE.Tamp_33772~~Tamp_33772.p2  ORF type:complete len:160 (+),score=19.69 Tamp_33772:33-512(+)